MNIDFPNEELFLNLYKKEAGIFIKILANIISVSSMLLYVLFLWLILPFEKQKLTKEVLKSLFYHIWVAVKYGIGKGIYELKDEERKQKWFKEYEGK
jgi:predicted membrane channel-forming protein YqfA (hemolysin III family)